MTPQILIGLIELHCNYKSEFSKTRLAEIMSSMTIKQNKPERKADVPKQTPMEQLSSRLISQK